MATFCGGCGFPQAANSGFCPNCGARQQGAASPQPRTPPTTTAPAKTNAGLKIVLVLAGFVVLAGVAAISGMVYVGHRVKDAVVEKAKAYGVDLPAALPQQTSSSSSHRLPKACDLLSKEETAKLLGEPIDRAEQTSEGCSYYGPPGLAATLAQEQASNTFRSVQTPGSNVPESQVATSVDQLAPSLGAAAGQAGSGGEAPLMILLLDPDGKAQMTAISASKALFNGLFNAAGAKGMSMGGEIAGLGDRAIRVQKLGLNVLKGEVLIRIVPGPVPDADTKTINVARAVLGKL